MPDALVLVRHGETDDNRPPLRFQGWRDTPLNDHGREQAANLAERVKGEGIAAIWSSDLSRARETGEIVAERLGIATIELDPRLREANRGDWEGRLFDDVARQEPEFFAAWMKAGPEWRFPGGESLLEQQKRVAASVEEIHSRSPLPALAVCHGGSIRVLLCLTDPRGLNAFHSFRVPNVSVVRM